MILRILILLLFAVTVSAEPFLTSDSDSDAVGWKVEFPAIELIVEGSTVDGAIWWDIGTWDRETYGTGWFDGSASFSQTYEVIDQTSFLSSSVFIYTGSSPFKLKIPKGVAPKGYKAIGQK